MGPLAGHVGLGGVFLAVGLWHLYNHIKLYATHKQHYNSPLPWFPSAIHRHLELYLIMVGAILFTGSELHARPFLDADGTIRSTRLHNYEHASMAMGFLIYSISAITLDKLRAVKGCNDVVWIVVSLAFAQQLLLFHFHSADHVGVESQYHLLLQLVVLLCLATCLMGVAFPRSFALGFTRSLSITLQGLWLLLMGFMLWTPAFMPKGCSIQRDKSGRDVVACGRSDGSLDRAKALVNIEFSSILIGLTAFGMSFYIFMLIKYEGFIILNEEEDVKYKHAHKTIDLEE